MKIKLVLAVLTVAMCTIPSCGKKEEAPKAIDSVVSIKESEVVTPTSDVTADYVDESYGGFAGDDYFLIDNEGAVGCTDVSAEYGVYSTTTDDAYDFLKSDGSVNLKSLGDAGEVGTYIYTGRFAFPSVAPCQYTGELTETWKTDMGVHYDYGHIGDEYQGVIDIDLGNDNYMFCFNTSAHVDGIADLIEYGKMTTPDGIEVLVMYRPVDDFGSSLYYWKLGPFSVTVHRIGNTEEYTKEQLQTIMDSINLM